MLTIKCPQKPPIYLKTQVRKTISCMLKCTTNVIDIYQVCLELDLEQRGNKIHKSTISRNKIADQICQCQKKRQ